MNDITFGNAENLWYLLSIPILIGLFILIRIEKQKKIKILGKTEITQKLILEKSRYKPIFKFSILMFALGLLIFAASRPLFVTETKIDSNSSNELIIALDISNSMLAEDIFPSRLERAKRVITILLEQNQGFRYSMILFKGSAFKQIPMTEDVTGFIPQVNALSPGMMTTPGTAIAEGLIKAIDSFPTGKETRKVIILFSDGGSEKIKREQELGRLLTEKKIRLIVVGCGSEKGAVIRFNDGTILLDKKDKPIEVKINREQLQYLAQMDKGGYYEIDQPGIIDQLINEMNQEASYIGVVDYSIKKPSQYKPFLLATLFWLGCFIYVRSKKIKGLF